MAIRRSRTAGLSNDINEMEERAWVGSMKSPFPLWTRGTRYELVVDETIEGVPVARRAPRLTVFVRKVTLGLWSRMPLSPPRDDMSTAGRSTYIS